MRIETIQNSDLHLEHKQWNTELSLWKDELKSFNKRLEELVVRYTNKDVLVKVEHYQNLFLIHDEAIHALQLHIEVHETNMAYHSKKGEDAIDLVYAQQHLEIKNRMETQRNIFGELKHEFFEFLSKYL
jgi:hypothetical protein